MPLCNRCYFRGGSHWYYTYLLFFDHGLQGILEQIDFYIVPYFICISYSEIFFGHFLKNNRFCFQSLLIQAKISIEEKKKFRCTPEEWWKAYRPKYNNPSKSLNIPLNYNHIIPEVYIPHFKNRLSVRFKDCQRF